MPSGGPSEVANFEIQSEDEDQEDDNEDDDQNQNHKKERKQRKLGKVKPRAKSPILINPNTRDGRLALKQ